MPCSIAGFPYFYGFRHQTMLCLFESLDFAFTLAARALGGSRQVSTRSFGGALTPAGFARRYLGNSRGFTEFDSSHLLGFPNSARFNKTGAFNRSANLPFAAIIYSAVNCR